MAIDINTCLKAGYALIDEGLTIAFAESATAGLLAGAFSLVPSSGQFLKGGLVCYDAELKVSILQVDRSIIEQYTPESMEVTKAISLGLQKLISADIHVGVTGLTAPGGSETSEKPVGTIFLYGITGNEVIFSERCVFAGNKEQIISSSIERCATLLFNYLTKKSN